MLKPVVKITSVEDSASSIDRRLLRAYFRTVYCVAEPPGFAFQPGRALSTEAAVWLRERQIGSWAFLTAWNPRSEVLPEAENRRRNQRMARAIEDGGWLFFCGKGIGLDASWPPEESFWILNIPLETAVQLGRMFGQNAFVGWEIGQPIELWWL